MTHLSCNGLDVCVPGKRLVEKLTASFPAGTVTCVLGRNGAGKTTTLHTLAGIRPPAAGTVSLDDSVLAGMRRRDIARRLGVVMQNTDDPFPATVSEMALIGRHPHLDFWAWESAEDRAIAHDALTAVGLHDMALRDVATLSGGERRRLAIATALAQKPDVYLLDEPVNQLDPPHQLEVLRLFRHHADAGRTVVASMHDLNLAARFADHALLLFGNGDWILAPAAEALVPDTLSRLFGVNIEQVSWRDRHLFVAA